MIFSKDKKPTKPGMYWAIYRGRLVACEVFSYTRGWALNINHTDSNGDRPLSQVHLAFGDRILRPSVEDSEHLGRQG